MKFVTTDPRSAGLADGIGAVRGYVSGGTIYTLLKVGSASTAWTSIPALLPSTPRDASITPVTSTDPRSAGRAAQVDEIVLYDNAGTGELLIKYGTGDTDWVQLPDTTGPGGGGLVTDGDKGDIIVSGSGATWVIDTCLYSKVVGLTPGSVVFAGATGALEQDNSNLFWDDTNNRLGIGTNAPQTLVHMKTNTTSVSFRLEATDPAGNASIDFYDDTGTNRWGIGYDNVPNRAQISLNNSSDLSIVDNIAGQRVKFFNNGNVNIGATTTDPSVLLRVEGATTLGTALTHAITLSGDTTANGNLLVKGDNTNTPASFVAAAEFYAGRTNAGANAGSASSMPDVAFQWAGASGGFRHFISSWHDSVAGSGNRLRFHINNSVGAGGSSTAGTGNIVMLDLRGDGTTIGAATTDSHTVNGRAALTNTTATASAFASTQNPTAGTTNTTTAGTFTNSGTYNTTAGVLSEFALRAVSSSTRSSGANNLTNVALYGTASGGQVNVALQTDAGNVLLNQTGGTFSCAGAATFTSTLQVDGNVTLNDGSGDTTRVNGYVGIGRAPDSNVQLTMLQEPTRGFGVLHLHTASSSAASFIGAQFTMEGTYNCTAAVRTAFGVAGVVTATRGSGANALTNIALYGDAADAQINYSFFGNRGTLYNAGNAQIDGDTTLNGNNTIGSGSADSHTVNGALNIVNGLRTSAELSPPQITADQNDYAPTGLDTTALAFISSDAARSITGILAAAGGKHLWLINSGAFNITLEYEHASSSAANRFYGNGAADLVLAPQNAVHLMYSATISRWVIVGFN